MKLEAIELEDMRELARLYFHQKRLSYKDIKEKDFYMLLSMLAEELDLYSESKKDPNIHGIATMKINVKKYRPRFKYKAKDGILEQASIQIDSHYFEGREGITFTKDGYIAFAGWADDTNLQPFIVAFKRFVDYLAKKAVKHATGI